MIFSHPPGNDLASLQAWARRLIDEINRFHPTVDAWPVFADDTDAAAGNLNVGEPYVTPSGQARRRMA